MLATNSHKSLLIGFFLFFCNSFVSAQKSKTLDLTLPDVYKYDLTDGLTTNCFEKVFQDPTGLLWLKSCAFVGWEFNHHFTIFDGQTPRLAEYSGDVFPVGVIVQALNITESGIIYGIYSDEVRSQNGIFLLNTIERKLEMIESSKLGSKDFPVISCQRDGEELVLLFRSTHGFDIKRFNFIDKEISEIVSKRYEFNEKLRSENRHNPHFGRFVDASYINYYQGKYWVLTGGLPFYVYDSNSDLFDQIDEQQLGESYLEYIENPEQAPIFMPQKNGDFILVLPLTNDGVFHFNFEKDLFSKLPNLFPLAREARAGISKSDKPQDLTVLRYFKTERNGYQNFLFHSNDNIQALNFSDAPREIFQIKRLVSGNTVVLSDAGLILLQNKDANPSKAYLEEFPTRGLFALDSTKVMVNLGGLGEQISIVDLSAENPKLETFGEGFQANDAGKFVQRSDGKIWIPSRELLGLIDLDSESIETFPNPYYNFEQYALFDDNTLMLIEEERLISWNPIENKTVELYGHDEILRRKGYLQAIHLHSTGSVYAAMGEGLLHVSKDYKSHEFIKRGTRYDKFNILSITEDKEGRLWLGTYSNGIQIFNPKTGEFTSVELSDGLLSNTIAVIEEDSQGNMWAGTFNGVSSINSKTLEVITTLTESDGIANNESNRFSSCRFEDGRIVIGSIKGFSVITPSSLKNAEEKEYLPEIILSAAYWVDSKTGENKETFGSNNTQIELPANERNIRLDLALTVYIQPELHKFKYKIGDSPWQFVGTNNTIYLNSLVSGSYDIQIKGIDHIGNETSNILTIPICVLPFFYQQWWFFVLCALPFVLFALAWVGRQRRIKADLVLEVKKATFKLEEDKVLIESQAVKLQELDKIKTRFFTNISHEFRTPLSVILGVANTLKNNEDENVKSSVKLIQKNSTVLLNLINQILDLVKLEAGELKIDYIQSDIVSFISQVVGGIKPLAESKNIDLNLDHQSNSLMMDFDQNKTFRILANLLSNAIKFTPDKGIISVKTKSESDFFILEVKDTGRGISDKNLPLIFNRFYQVDSSNTREGEGTGVGLNFTKELVELLGGKISVQSSEGKGTNFRVKLPLNNQAEQIQADLLNTPESLLQRGYIKEEESPITMEAQDDLPVLLVVEDNADITKLLVMILSSIYKVETAKNGQIGIDKAIELVPDFILSDVMMPVKDGVEVVNELKNHSATSHIPIILLTAKADLESRIEGLRRGADDYISKPFNEEELKLRIKNTLESKRRIQERYESGAPVELSTSPELEMEDAFILDLQKCLDRNLDNSEFGINDFCQELGVSRMQMHNKLTALTGLSTSNYIRSLRLNKARDLVLNSELNVSEIGYAVGFSSSAYFSRSFSNKFGASPSNYREQHQK